MNTMMECMSVSSSPITASVVKISPNNKFIAYIHGIKCFIVDTFTQKPIKTVTCLDKINTCSFSHDSDRVLCLIKERNVVQAFSVSDHDWKCRINEGT